jgi:predicted permease
MKIPLVAGRDLTEKDASSLEPLLISESMARRFWPGESAVGKRLRISFTPEIRREVVGVVGDVKDGGLDALDPVPTIYEPLQQDARDEIALVVRTTGDPAAIVAPVTGILREIDPEAPVRDPLALEEVVAASLSQRRFSMLLFAAMAGLAVVLAAIGIYSVLAYAVRSRVQEIGIRMAMGAGTADVLRLVVSEGMRPAVAGIVLGGAGAYALSGVLTRLVYGVSPADPITFAAVAALLGSVALAACLVPAYRAAKVGPLEALRNE